MASHKKRRLDGQEEEQEQEVAATAAATAELPPHLREEEPAAAVTNTDPSQQRIAQLEARLKHLRDWMARVQSCMQANPMQRDAVFNARRLFVGGVPTGTGDEELSKFLSDAITASGAAVSSRGRPVIFCRIQRDKNYAFVEVRSAEEASNAMALDGLVFTDGAVLKIKRPSKYDPQASLLLGPGEPDPTIDLSQVEISRPPVPAAADGTLIDGGQQPGASGFGGRYEATLNTLYIGGLPMEWSQEQCLELLRMYGEVKYFRLMLDRNTGNSRGFCFAEFTTDEATVQALTALNGAQLGPRTIAANRMLEHKHKQQLQMQLGGGYYGNQQQQQMMGMGGMQQQQWGGGGYAGGEFGGGAAGFGGGSGGGMGMGVGMGAGGMQQQGYGGAGMPGSMAPAAAAGGGYGYPMGSQQQPQQQQQQQQLGMPYGAGDAAAADGGALLGGGQMGVAGAANGAQMGGQLQAGMGAGGGQLGVNGFGGGMHAGYANGGQLQDPSGMYYGQQMPQQDGLMMGGAAAGGSVSAGMAAGAAAGAAAGGAAAGMGGMGAAGAGYGQQPDMQQQQLQGAGMGGGLPMGAQHQMGPDMQAMAMQQQQQQQQMAQPPPPPRTADANAAGLANGPHSGGVMGGGGNMGSWQQQQQPGWMPGSQHMPHWG